MNKHVWERENMAMIESKIKWKELYQILPSLNMKSFYFPSFNSIILSRLSFFKKKILTIMDEITQWVKALVNKPGDLNLVPGTTKMEKGD